MRVNVFFGKIFNPFGKLLLEYVYFCNVNKKEYKQLK